MTRRPADADAAASQAAAPVTSRPSTSSSRPSPRAARPLLPDARLDPRRRRRPSRHAAPGMAGTAALRRAQLAAHLALHDRHQRLPRTDRTHGRDEPSRRRPRSTPTRRRVAGAADEFAWLEPYPASTPPVFSRRRRERRESVELAFVAAFQHLPANQRAVLLLRDVLGFSAEETAPSSIPPFAAVTSALQRAQAPVGGRRRPQPTGEPARARRPRVRTLVDAYVDAWERRTAAIVSLLTDDATFSMPPDPSGTEAGRPSRVPRRRPLSIAGGSSRRASNQLAFGCYIPDNGSGRRTRSTSSRCETTASSRSPASSKRTSSRCSTPWAWSGSQRDDGG